MKKKWIAIGVTTLLLGLPMTVSASGYWVGTENVTVIRQNIQLLDEILDQRESAILQLNEEISTLQAENTAKQNKITQLEKEVVLNKETKDKAEAFDVITKTIRDESGIDIHTGNYQSTLTRLTKLYHNNWFVRTAARTIIEWLF